MAEPFLSEVRLMSFAFAPKGWAQCNGQLLPINQNQALFSLLGTTFGGDGRVNFALPDLRGRTPIHVGVGHTLGERGGEQAHTLSIAEAPQHTHAVAASTSASGGSATPNGNYLGGGNNVYFAPAGWMFCEGQLLPISENETLYQLIGTTYGGDGQSTFALPDLRGRIPVHQGNGFILAETGGAEEITLTVSQIPAHSHAYLGATGNGSQASPENNVVASSTLVKPYAVE